MDTTTDLLQILPRIAARTWQFSTNFIAEALFPTFPVIQPNGSYWLVADGVSAEAPPDIKRAPGTGAARSTTRLTSDNYSCEIYTQEEPVADSEDKKYATPGSSRIVATRRCQNVILLAKEIRVAALVTDDSVPHADLVTPWSDNASDPLSDIALARQEVFDGSACEPNVVAMGRAVYETVKRHPSIKAVAKLSANDARWPTVLAGIFDVDRVVVARGVINNAQEGDAIDLEAIWGNVVVVAHVDDTENLEAPSFGRTFAVTKLDQIVSDGAERPDATAAAGNNNDGINPSILASIEFSMYRAEPIRSTIIRIQQWTDEKITAPNSGFVLRNVLG